VKVSVEIKFSDNNSDDVRILAVGDIMLGISSLRAIAEKNTLPMYIKKSPLYLIEDVLPILENSDILFGNLECVLSKDFDYNDFDNPKLIMAPKEAVSLLKESNFSILNLANNHILDYGDEKVCETISILEQCNIRYLAAPNTISEYDIQIFKLKNKKIGFLGYNLCDQGKKHQISEIFNSIKSNKKLVDILIISLHWGWGYEHNSYPSSDQISLGHELIDKGADIILGHHSHVFQPIEIYNGKVIAYSLGNFIFDMWRIENKVSGILEIRVNSKNNLSVKVLETEQSEYKLKFKSEDINNIRGLVLNNLEDKVCPDSYEACALKIKKTHNKEIILYYLLNFYKFSIGFHCHNIIRWGSKFSDKLCKIHRK